MNLCCVVVHFSCSFECFKKHKNVDCAPAKTEINENRPQSEDIRKSILQFTTEDTVDPEKLVQLGMYWRCTWFFALVTILLHFPIVKTLQFPWYEILIVAFNSTGNSEALKDLLRNPHLREFIRAVDSSPNARKAMKFAMLEPLFIEFADECMKIVEPEETNQT